MFYKQFAERMNTIEKLHKVIDFTKLTYHYKSSTGNVSFNHFIDAATLMHNATYDAIQRKRLLN